MPTAKSQFPNSTDPTGEFPVAPQDYIFFLQLFIVRLRNIAMDEALEPLGVNLARHRAMVILDGFQPCTMRELAEFSVIDRTTMTRTVDGLVEAGWVDRARSPQDRREVIVTLTPAGLAKVREGYPVGRTLNRTALDGISEQEQRELVRLTQKVLANLAPDTATRERLLGFKRRNPELA
jgi:DNA-binding MarR family transcriptional regulator